MNARAALNGELEMVWRAKQEVQPGTPLPAAFPFRAELFAAGYQAREDLLGADQDELIKITSLSPRQADEVIESLAGLLV